MMNPIIILNLDFDTGCVLFGVDQSAQGEQSVAVVKNRPIVAANCSEFSVAEIRGTARVAWSSKLVRLQHRHLQPGV